MNQEPTPVRLSAAKRLLDVAVSLIIIAVLSPLLVLIALMILIEGLFIPQNRGPIFYKETRITQGKPFKLKKFRIFKVAAYKPIRKSGEIVHTKALERNPENITYTGYLLKKFYLDEAPQLFSVLKGDMSLVGPRPWNPVDYEKEIAKGIYRKKVIKAGLTGPVQIHKKDADKFGGERKLDNDYIEFNRTHSGIRVALHDLNLLGKSFWFMLKGEGL